MQSFGWGFRRFGSFRPPHSGCHGRRTRFRRTFRTALSGGARATISRYAARKTCTARSFRMCGGTLARTTGGFGTTGTTCFCWYGFRRRFGVQWFGTNLFRPRWRSTCFRRCRRAESLPRTPAGSGCGQTLLWTSFRRAAPGSRWCLDWCRRTFFGG